MPPVGSRTYDQRDEMALNETGTDPTSLGMWTLNNGNFRYQDGIGKFNPRDWFTNIIEGPTNNSGAGLYKTVTGGAFPSSIVWYYDAAKTKICVSKVLTFLNNNPATPGTVTYKYYDTTGALVKTCTDTITYQSGTIFETSRTRVFS